MTIVVLGEFVVHRSHHFEGPFVPPRRSGGCKMMETSANSRRVGVVRGEGMVKMVLLVDPQRVGRVEMGGRARYQSHIGDVVVILELEARRRRKIFVFDGIHFVG